MGRVVLQSSSRGTLGCSGIQSCVTEMSGSYYAEEVDLDDGELMVFSDGVEKSPEDVTRVPT